MKHRLECHTLMDILASRVSDQRYQIAYRFLSDGEDDEAVVSYVELDRKIRAISRGLTKLNIEDRAVLLYPPGLDFIYSFYACLNSGVIAVPIYPPHPARPGKSLPLIKQIIEDSSPKVILTTETIKEALLERTDLLTYYPALDIIATSKPDVYEGDGKLRAAQPSDIAFLQYTSGSTGSPKGVMVTHANLLSNLAYIERNFGLNHKSDAVFWLPPYHDMGLIGGILQALYTGYPLTLIPHMAFLQKPVRWLKAITKYKAHTAGAPNFAYDLCVRNIPLEQREGLDLSSWNIAFDGAEHIYKATMERFSHSFAPYGFNATAFVPCYGLAEATLLVTSSPVGQQVEEITLSWESAQGDTKSGRYVSCGHIDDQTNVRIVQPDSLIEIQSNEVGEIWVSGPGVTKGYWNSTAETERVFNAYIPGSKVGPYMRTGDLGFISGNSLYVAGRLKDLIIIAGINYYPDDLEKTAEDSHPVLGVKSCVAFSIEKEEQERLVILFELNPKHLAQADEIIQSVRGALAGNHGLGAYEIVGVNPGDLPKTSSGKIKRHRCKSLYHQGKFNKAIAP